MIKIDNFISFYKTDVNKRFLKTSERELYKGHARDLLQELNMVLYEIYIFLSGY